MRNNYEMGIKELRAKLKSLVQQKCLQDKEVYYKSQELDKLIVQYMKKNK